MYSLRSLTLSEWAIVFEGSASEEEDEDVEEGKGAAAAFPAVTPPPPTPPSAGFRSLCGVSRRRSVDGGLAADEWSTPMGLLCIIAPEGTTNTERGDTGSLGGVDGGEDEEEEEEEGASGLAGVAGAEWIAAGRAAAEVASAARLPLFTTAILAITRTRLGVVVEDANMEEAAAAAAAFFPTFAFLSLPFFMPAPLSVPSGPKNLA